MLDDEGNNLDDAYDQLDDESIFCTSCADRIFGLMFVKAIGNLFQAADRSHSPCVPKQACRYGRSCRAMNLAMHCAKFHHWCPPTEAIAKATAPFRHDLLLSSKEIPDNGIYWPVETSLAIHEEEIHAIVATNTSETNAMAPMIPVTNDLKRYTHSVLSKRPYAGCS
ncbi:hypothetical protein BC940DRAFT_295969 [Gongronella butleri]|nr:hypothetical protein BC940DRAFT_295969 [Gongronella butleri]